MEKKYTGLVVCNTVLILIVLGLVGFIFGSMIFAGLYYSLEVFKEDKKYLDSCLKFND